MSENNSIDLRDQFAVAAMQAILSQQRPYTMKVDTGTQSMTGSTITSTYGTSNEQALEQPSQFFERLTKMLPDIARFAYKAADEMRKARLEVFQ